MEFRHHVRAIRTTVSRRSRPLIGLVVAALFAAWGPATAQISVALTGGVHSNSSASTFTQLEGVPSPGPLTFTQSSSAVGGHLALQADVPVVSLFSAGLRASAGPWTSTFTATERQPIATPDGTVYLATLTHTFDGRLTMLAAEPYVRVTPLPWLAFDLGFPFYFPLSSHYDQTVRFTDPPDLEFADGSIVQQTGTGAIPNLRTAIPGIATRVEGSLPMDSSGAIRLVAQLSYEQQLGSIVTVQSVTLGQLSANIGVRYTFPRSSGAEPSLSRIDTVITRDTTVVFEPHARDTIMMIDRSAVTETVADGSPSGRTVVTIRERYRHVMEKPPAVLQVSLTLSFVKEGGQESPSADLTIRRVQVESEHRYAPFILFDEGASIPRRYTDPMAQSHWHHGILRALASSMKKNARAVVTVAAQDESQARAVQQELVRLGVPRERVKTARDASVERDVVRIMDPSVLPKAIVRDTVMDTRLPIVHIRPDIATDTDVASWELDIRQRAAIIHHADGSGMPPEIITWDIASTMTADSALAAPFGVTLSVTDHQGQTARSEEGKLELTSTATTEPGGTLHTRKDSSARVNVEGLVEREVRWYR